MTPEERIVKVFQTLDHEVDFEQEESQWVCRATYVGTATYSDRVTNGQGPTKVKAGLDALKAAMLNKPELPWEGAASLPCGGGPGHAHL